MRPTALRCALGLLLLPTAALAYREGVTGSARDGCTSCHGSSVSDAVQVTLAGPGTLDAGTRAPYTLTVRGGPARVAGFDVAVSYGGGRLEAGEGSQLAGDDVTHVQPQAFDGGVATFHFFLRAPEQARTVTLYGAANSANGDGRSSGDAFNTTTLSVKVLGAAAPDAGTAPDAGSAPDAGAPPVAGTPVEDVTAGCAAGGGGLPSALGALGALGALALLRRRTLRG